jgi:hypothetical protein
MQTLSPVSIPTEEQVFIDRVIGSRRGRPGALPGILEAAQERNRHKYLPLETLRYIAAKTEVPLSRIYSVATFYALFNLQPQGETPSAFAAERHVIHAARATCCRERAWNWSASILLTEPSSAKAC